jgi:hypothetical protein
MEAVSLEQAQKSAAVFRDCISTVVHMNKGVRQMPGLEINDQ